MDKILTPQLRKVLASYGRSALAAAVALYLSGITDWRLLLNAAIAAVLGPLIRALNPKDKAFGIAAEKVVADILTKSVKATPAPAKKAPAKKATNTKK